MVGGREGGERERRVGRDREGGKGEGRDGDGKRRIQGI